MTLSNIAAKNVKGNLYRYIMYYLSNTFAVTVFFIFANFVMNSKVVKEGGEGLAKQFGSKAMIEALNKGLIACQIIIVIFTVLFVGYSISMFIKSRGKEFGLLSLFGMTTRQIKKYVMVESTIISIVSILSGIILGSAFSKLFFLIMGSFLGGNIPFSVSLKAVGLTLIVFFVLFELINAFMLVKIKSKEIVEQIKSNKVPKELPKFSVLKSLLGVGLLGAGYFIASTIKPIQVVAAFIPVILLVITGTYFIFTQFSLAITTRLRNNKSIFYKQTNMIALSQMIFKLKDTAKVLFLAAILGAITFTATETVYTFFTEIPEMASMGMADEISFIESKESKDIDVTEIKNILKKHNINVDYYNKVDGIELTRKIKNVSSGNNEEEMEQIFTAISNSQYNKIAKKIGSKQLKLNKDEGVYIYPFDPNQFEDKKDNNKKKKILNEDKLLLSIGDSTKEYKIKEEIYKSVINVTFTEYSDLLVISDEAFKDISNKASEEQVMTYHGMKLKNWKDSLEASKEIQSKIIKSEDKHVSGENGYYYSKIIPYTEQRSTMGMTLFIGFFIAFLFFIAAGSIIYFKLFNDIKQDDIEYGILRNIGASRKNIKSIITKQTGIIFFLPFVVGVVHSLFALKPLGAMLQKNLIMNGLTVAGGYLVFQIIYFLVIRTIYIKKMEALK
ncbi:ABC-type transport system, involved in lipoprotein release, permease component [Gottschalkia purinilytica]|uniref:ABC-type transport system, involved in lipoprotein release, permease component n=1 Tax=Gottschalkia purinilytica TaxID=1503 RepID=A0A0L0WDN9_GOTPU|nr:ABC transporter permease [Gottschalkia purinilytica]KNF09593.1 ABC-type transport system, involved in lipoprotein release, permease component [Gottschalkia purinilytica]